MTTEMTTQTDFRKRRLDEIFVHVGVPQHDGFSHASDDEMERRAKEVLAQVNRHVDADGAYIDRTYDFECPDCTATWTEDSTIYNGGCCDADEKRVTTQEATHAK